MDHREQIIKARANDKRLRKAASSYGIESGQPSAKIPNDRGQSGSSGVYRLTTGQVPTPGGSIGRTQDKFGQPVNQDQTNVDARQEEKAPSGAPTYDQYSTVSQSRMPRSIGATPNEGRRGLFPPGGEFREENPDAGPMSGSPEVAMEEPPQPNPTPSGQYNEFMVDAQRRRALQLARVKTSDLQREADIQLVKRVLGRGTNR